MVASAAATSLALGAGLVLVDRALFWRHERHVLLRHASKDELAPAGVDGRILFLGDSIFEGFPLRALLPQGFITLNRGISGDTIARIARRYHDEAGVTEHDVVVIEGGINDILRDEPSGADDAEFAGRIARSYAAIIDDARRHSREPIALSILPMTSRTLTGYTGAIPLPTGLDLVRVNARVRAVNSRLRALCDERKIPFVDAHAALVDARGELRRSFGMADGLHINCSGYEAMAEIVTPELVRLLRPPGCGTGRPRALSSGAQAAGSLPPEPTRGVSSGEGRRGLDPSASESSRTPR